MPLPVFPLAIPFLPLPQMPRLAVWHRASALIAARRFLSAIPALRRLTFVFSFSAILVGCGLSIPLHEPLSRARITPVQSCAIGYDLARLIHQNISLRETVIITPRRANACEARALQYLRLAGFAVEDTGGATRGANTRPGFDVVLTPTQDGSIDAVATIAGTLHIARRYRLAETGVYPVSAASIAALPAPYQRRSSQAFQNQGPQTIGGETR